MSIPFKLKVNEHTPGPLITNEQHLVGILATITYSPGNIRLIEVPEAPAPFSTVDIWGGSGHTGTHYNEIFSGTPTGTQYLVDYTTGVVSFSTSQDGNTVYVDYNGRGSEWAAEDVNEIQNPLGTVATQVVTYNWPSAPTVSWKLADTIVKPASISTTPTDIFTFPSDVVTTGSFISQTGTDNNSTTIGPYASLDMEADSTGGPTDPHIFFDNTNSGVNSEIGLDSANGDRVSITGTSFGGSTISGPVLTYLTQTGKLFVPSTLLVAGISPINHWVAVINPSAILELDSTTQGLLPPRMTTVQRNAISSPATGLEIYNITTQELEFYNGTSWVPAAGSPSSGVSGAVQFSNGSGLFSSDATKFFWDDTNFRLGIGTNSPSVSLDVNGNVNISSNITVPTGSIIQAETYSGSGSEQGIASDETLNAGAGSNTPTDPKYLAAMMGNVHGTSLTKTSNYIAGVIGADSVTGTQTTTYPKGAVLAQITDGVTASDGAVVAYIDGDTSLTLANAAFKAMQNNSTPGSGFTYGLDLFGAAHDGYLELSIKNAAIRMDHEVCIFNGSGTPINGVTGATFAQIGSLYINNSTGDLYSNTGTKAVPVWTIFDTGTTGANIHLSNLSGVAVNTSLLPGSDDSIDLGSSSFRWKNLLLSETGLIGGTSINASAILDLQSTTKGFLPPRMTTAQRTAISSPAKGLIVYDTDLDQFMGYSGSWVILG